MMTDTVVAMEPQQEEHDKTVPAAFVGDQPSRVDGVPAGPVALSSAETQLMRGLVRRTRAAGGDLTGPDGLLKSLTKTVIEAALEEELVDHLGYSLLSVVPWLVKRCCRARWALRSRIRVW